MSAVLAHQGGWDEILLVLGPILVIAGLLMLAKRRVERSAAALKSRAEPDARAFDGGPHEWSDDR